MSLPSHAPGPNNPAAPQWGGQPQAWTPQTWAPGTAYGWGAPPGRPAASGTRGVARPRWAGTIAVAMIVSAVVLGGIVADDAIPVPSAGRVAISQPVSMTAAPGWVTTTAAGDITDGLALQNSSALLVAQVLSTSYDRDSRQLLETSMAGFGADAAQITFGDERDVVINGKPASEITFSALVSDAGSSGMIDGELVCLVVQSGGHGYAVFIQVAAPQGHLSSLTDDIDAMAGSVGVSQ
jgi:hypothetical protein